MDDPTNPDNPLYLGFMNALNLEKLSFPLGSTDIQQFLKQNKELGITLHFFQFYKKVLMISSITS